MPVPDTIQQLRAARAAHKAWVVRAEALVNGLPVDKNQVPVVATECGFGKWYYGDGSRLQGFSVFTKIEAVHNALHQVYTDIFKLLSEEASGMNKLLGQGKKLKKANQYKSEMLLPKLHSHYDDIIVLLGILEKDYLTFKDESKVKEASASMEELQTKSFRDVSKMMDDLEKDVDSWLK